MLTTKRKQLLKTHHVPLKRVEGIWKGGASPIYTNLGGGDTISVEGGQYLLADSVRGGTESASRFCPGGPTPVSGRIGDPIELGTTPSPILCRTGNPCVEMRTLKKIIHYQI